MTSPMPRMGTKAVNIKYITQVSQLTISAQDPLRTHSHTLACPYPCTSAGQVKSRPPTFALFCNTTELPTHFQRFIRSRLQYDFSLQGVPIRIIIRKTKGKAVNKSLLKQGKHSRRGIGRNEARGVGPRNRSNKAKILRKIMAVQNKRRRRDTRLNRQRASKKK
jgi:KH-domain-like of EngA bacterial GTPase enzymes, C-terminal